ncbi:hypothetical protein Dtox_3015 [Desulfofarcimen acetoxidans DSM 771]|jgi:hypothetical protein|uniref:Uncharacterized protein n=1 Tax=Desulfofarcimen acetoxidans (strain ATCC 49208 / DSM 771 / KCTC 5769 / VKM B-1644 / 5575) TaxID=485916 RepID=C8W3I1_DESAS|nr:hypothetical protein [Desulfofarcimen acetoxidans]ACV63767.1 hypothetical protein Dtox_3015 [Desulfofarcimen acetoxidans DSM 771]
MEFIKRHLSDMLPHYKNKDPFCFGPGSGWVTKSFFTAYESEIIWLVYIKELDTYAHLKVGSTWIETCAPLILNSPHVFVSWTEKHKIIYWAVGQEKSKLHYEHCKEKKSQ